MMKVLRPDHLSATWCGRIFTDVFERYGDDLAARRPSRPTTGPRRDPGGAAVAAERRGESGQPSRPRLGVGAPRLFLRQLRQGDHQPARAERRHRGRLHAGPDPQRRQSYGGPTAARTTRSRSSPILPYAGVYATVIEGREEERPGSTPATIGTVPEHRPHGAGPRRSTARTNKTFEIPANGTVYHRQPGRRCPCSPTTSRSATSGAPARPRTSPVRDWVKLAVTRAPRLADPGDLSGWTSPAPHDAELIKKIDAYLPEHDTTGL